MNILAIIGGVAVVGILLLVLLVCSGALPNLQTLPPLCLQAGLVCDMKTDGAVVSTASATWWLVPTTGVGAIATFFAVVVALRQDAVRARAEDKERTRINRAVRNAILETYAFCRTAKATVLAMDEPDPKEGWDLYGTMASHRRTLEHFLTQRITNDTLVFECNTAIQRLHEMNAALDRITISNQFNLVSSQATLTNVETRINRSGPTVEKCEIVVENGLMKGDRLAC
jgi:hypothetical protein